MKCFFEQITDQVYGFLLWDESWNSYNNCYLITGENGHTLIDSGKEEHFEYLEAAMKNVNVEKGKIATLIATHGHKDHIGGLSFLEGTECFIHSEDLDLVPENLKAKLTATLSENSAAISDLECILLGHHTSGSIAIFHRESGVLFCGDHLCFFGEPLTGEAVISDGKGMKEKYINFISEWKKNKEMRRKHDFELFMGGLKALCAFDAKYLCTGHGMVINDNVHSFLDDLIRAGE